MTTPPSSLLLIDVTSSSASSPCSSIDAASVKPRSRRRFCVDPLSIIPRLNHQARPWALKPSVGVSAVIHQSQEPSIGLRSLPVESNPCCHHLEPATIQPLHHGTRVPLSSNQHPSISVQDPSLLLPPIQDPPRPLLSLCS
ncbi:hypothetical protein M0R45_015798 [Rubus argutus]|uniref:Uncharacterized protein n=1 Tax=Rubus argutus TaxID=59490 RepID=A0AAW1XT48_RUBAR